MKKINFSELRSLDPVYIFKRARRSLTEQWYFAGERASEDRKRLLLCTYNANIVANMIGGSFWTGFLLLIQADDSFIGTMTMITAAANMLQMFAPLLLERFTRRKPLIMAMRGILMFINIVFIGLIPLFPIARQSQLTLTALSILAVNLINALIAPGISIWHIQSIPPRVRAGFYSLITMTTGAVVAIANYLGGLAVDAFKANGLEYWGLFALRMVALLLAVYDMYLYGKVAEYPYEQSAANRVGLKDLLLKPLREKAYRKTVAVAFLWCFAANIPGAFYSVYLLKTLQVNYSYLMIINMVNVPVVLFLTPYWRKIQAKFGWFKTLYIAMGLYLIHYVGLAFVGHQSLWLYPVFAVWSFLMAIGINLCFSAIPYVNMPEKNQTVFIGFYSTIANFAALLGVLFGKYFIQWTEPVSIRLLGVTMVNKQLLMLATAIVMLAATIGIARIHRSMPKGQDQ